jgi:lipopolysaccharide transport system permease protein
MTLARRWRHLRDVIRVLVMRDQRSRYKSTVFGVIWAVASPALFLMTFYVLFRFVMPLQVEDYAAHLFIGLVAWAWFQGSVTESVATIVGNPGLMSQPGFPRAALPAAAAVSNLLTLVLTLPLLVVILAASATRPGWAALALPLLVLLQLLVVLAFSYLVAALNVTFRDLQYIVPIVLQLGYFVTPIFYDAAAVPDGPRQVLALNPMLQIIEGYRAVLIRGEWPDAGPLAAVALGAVLGLAAAVAIFRRASLRFLEDV